MKVKDLKKQLKNQFDNIIPYHTDRRNVIPFTQLGKEFQNLTTKEFDKVLDEKDVVDYKLEKPKKVACWNVKDNRLSDGYYKTQTTLIIYFE